MLQKHAPMGFKFIIFPEMASSPSVAGAPPSIFVLRRRLAGTHFVLAFYAWMNLEQGGPAMDVGVELIFIR